MDRIVIKDVAIGSIHKRDDGKIHFYFTTDGEVSHEVILNDLGHDIFLGIITNPYSAKEFEK